MWPRTVSCSWLMRWKRGLDMVMTWVPAEEPVKRAMRVAEAIKRLRAISVIVSDDVDGGEDDLDDGMMNGVR